MFNKRNKKRGFTLIELIIVIAIIAILAAIAVPAFGQIRQKANASTDLANARTMFSVVSTEIASDNVKLPSFNGTTAQKKYYAITSVGEAKSDSDKAGSINITDFMSETKVKQYPNYQFIISLDSDGDIAVGIAPGAPSSGAIPANYQFIYGDESHAK